MNQTGKIKQNTSKSIQSIDLDLTEQKEKQQINIQPKVSIIIPICNVEFALRECLDSALAQTMKEIEIICIDDRSTDGCIDILKEYAAKDARIITFFHEENQSTSQCRKDGVLASQGKYIMFLDGDDTLVPSACEKAYIAIEKAGTDMLHFGTEIINCGNFPENRIQLNERLLKPYVGKLEDTDLLIKCWDEKKFGFNLWNKIYNGDICRKAFYEILDGQYPKAQDLYAFFLIAYYSHSYTGIPEKLYQYNFGLGVTGGKSLSIDKFEKLLTQRRIVDALEKFIQSKPDGEAYIEIVSQIKKQLLTECVDKWQNLVPIECCSEAFDALVNAWDGPGDIICLLAEKNWSNRVALAAKMRNVDYFHHVDTQKKQKKTVAAYYRCINNGGAQRVVAMLSNIWAEQKDEDGNYLYNVVLITDGAASSIDYEVSPLVKREFLPDYTQAVKEAYRPRYEKWQQIIEENKIDIVVTSLWVGNCTFWDMLSVKSHPSKPAFCIHSHNFCGVPFGWSNSIAQELTYNYEICDGVVTLSECDKAYVSAYASNVRCIVNPLAFSPKEKQSIYEKNVLVWVGRFSAEKRPLDAIRMMEYIVREIPDAILYMVGSGNEILEEKAQELITELNLTQNVIMTGFSEHVEEYYERASVMICTSEYEGFSLTLCEAMSHGLPVISYSMPYLTIMQDGRGILTTEQERYDQLATEAVRLLRNPELCRELGNQGQAQILDLENTDIAGEWHEFFNQITTFKAAKEKNMDSIEHILFRQFTLFDHKGKKAAAKATKISPLNAVRKLHTARVDIKNESENAESNLLIEATSEQAECRITNPEWFCDENGIGYQIECSGESMEIKAICQNNGVFKLALRSVNFTCNDEKFPIYINYEMVSVNRKVIAKNKMCTHDIPIKYEMNVCKGDVVHIRLQWSPQKYTGSVLDNIMSQMLYGHGINDDTIIENTLSSDVVEIVKMPPLDAIQKLHTARVDIKNEGENAANNLLVEAVSEQAECQITTPEWFCDENGIGYQIECPGESMEIKAVCQNDGTFKLSLRSVNLICNEEKVPIYINYETVSVNDKVIAKNKMCTHDKPIKYEMNVCKGDLIHIKLRWTSQKYVGSVLSDIMSRMIYGHSINNDAAAKNTIGKNEDNSEIKKLQKQLKDIKSSYSYRIGRFLTTPMRIFKKR